MSIVVVATVFRSMDHLSSERIDGGSEALAPGALWGGKTYFLAAFPLLRVLIVTKHLARRFRRCSSPATLTQYPLVYVAFLDIVEAVTLHTADLSW